MAWPEWLRLVIASGGVGALGGVAAVFGLSRWLGDVWLGRILEKEKAKYAQDIEILKAGFSHQLEQLRHDINALFSRISKIHEKEFEVLPKAWQLLHEANGAVFQAIKALKRYPDFSQMSEPQFEEFARACRLPDFQKNELRDAKNSKDRSKYYQEALFWVELGEAKRAQTELNNYLAVNSIFMTESLRQQFRDINAALASVLISDEVGHGQGYSPELQKSIADNLDKIADLFGKIESAVQKRLRYEAA